MKTCCLFLLSFCFSLLSAQQTSTKFAAKNIQTRLEWPDQPGLFAINAACGMQFLPHNAQLNLVIYPKQFVWPEAEKHEAFLSDYVDEPQFRSAHFDGTLHFQNSPDFSVPGLYPCTISGNWIWKGSPYPGNLNGNLEVLQSGEIRISCTGTFSWTQFGVIPVNRQKLDLPDITFIRISGLLQNM